MSTSVAPLEAVLPATQPLAANWHTAPRRWGHPLHGVCSYFAMFPPQLARYMIEWLTEPGDLVYDPFSGRGTTALESVRLGRAALASDANPLSVALSQAKVRIPSLSQAARRVRKLRAGFLPAHVAIEGEPDDIRMLYSDHTLRQLVYLKAALRRGHPVDSLIIAVCLGMLHANHSSSGATAGFSISMPNAFAMSPGYVRGYIAEHGLVRPDVDVFTMVEDKLGRLGLPDEPIDAGRAWAQDATSLPPKALRDRPADLVLTSPPYLQVIQYGKYNWVRLWFLGAPPKEVDALLMSSGSLPKYHAFMDAVLRRIRTVVSDDGFVCLVIGDVRRKGVDLDLAQSVWGHVASKQGWHLHGIYPDNIPVQHKVSRIWKNQPGKATKVDRLLLVSPSPRDLPERITVGWERLSGFGKDPTPT